MNNIKQTLRSFIDRGGHYIFSSTMMSKILNFALSIIIVRILSKEVYGNISYANSIMQILMALAGFGLHNSLLRFGAIEKSVEGKNNIFRNLLKWGSIFSLILVVVVYLSSDLISIRLPGAAQYLRLFSPLIYTFFLLQLMLYFFRIHKNNRLYSIGIMVKSVLIVLFCTLFALLFGGKGYVIAYTTVPIIVAMAMFIFANKQYKIFPVPIIKKINIKPLINYGIWVGLGTIASQFVIMMDTIMVGNIIADSSQLALYKVATILPMNLLALPIVLLTTDYVYIAEKYNDKVFLKNYYMKYLKLFLVIVIAILAGWFIFDDLIIKLFGSGYEGVKPLISVLFIMLAGSFLFRIPLGNIIAAVGKSKWNGISNIFLVVVNFTLNSLLIPRYGLMGAAISSVISIWFSGLIDIILFKYYLKKYCN
jgi:O-antigen/teichoic acid export membrane protein